MSIPPNVITGQSVSDEVNTQKPTVTHGDLSQGDANPADKIDRPARPRINGQALQFPSDNMNYYMFFKIGKYHRVSWTEVGTLNNEASFILPLPATMIDNHRIQYQVENLGIAGAGGMMLGAASQINDNNINETLNHLMQQANVNTESVMTTVGAIAAKQAGAAGHGALAGAGYSVNDFMTVMMKGPTYKERSFVWRLSPNSASESERLRTIIQIINNSMAPSLAGIGSMFFKWPSIWEPEFKYLGEESRDLSLQTFRMKKSVLVNASFNYTPQGIPSFFGTTSAPESIEVRLDFMELEYWLKGQF